MTLLTRAYVLQQTKWLTPAALLQQKKQLVRSLTLLQQTKYLCRCSAARATSPRSLSRLGLGCFAAAATSAPAGAASLRTTATAYSGRIAFGAQRRPAGHF